MDSGFTQNLLTARAGFCLCILGLANSLILGDFVGSDILPTEVSCRPSLNGRGSPFCEVMVFTFTDAGYLTLAASLGFRIEVLCQVVDQLSSLRPITELLLLLEVD